MISLEEKVKLVRKLKNLTQEEVAKQLAISRSTIANWEIGASSVQRNTRPRVEAWVEESLSEIARKDVKEKTFHSRLISGLGLTEMKNETVC